MALSDYIDALRQCAERSAIDGGYGLWRRESCGEGRIILMVRVGRATPCAR